LITENCSATLQDFLNRVSGMLASGKIVIQFQFNFYSVFVA